MLILLVLGLFLTLSYYVLSSYESVSHTHRYISTVYYKERDLIFLNSVLPRVIAFINSDNPTYDSLSDSWNKEYVMKTPLGNIELKIEDLDRYFNLNTVAFSNRTRQVFENLLNLLDISPQLLELLLIWEGVENATDWEYPYPPKGAPLDSIYELELFWSNKEDLYGKERDFLKYPGLYNLTTVYSCGKVNINTAPYFILRALDSSIDDILAREIIEYRKEHPFHSINELISVEGVDADLIYRLNFIADVKSCFFKIHMKLKDSNGIVLNLIVIYDRAHRKIINRKVY
jgi:general secretion pathway protein K